MTGFSVKAHDTVVTPDNRSGLMKTLLALAFAFLSTSSVAQENPILRVSAISVKTTDICSNCSPDNAHKSYWTVYRARVRETLQGAPRKKEVTFAYAQHAQYIRSVLKDFVVVLQPAPDWLREKTAADYVVVALDFPKIAVCFEPEYIQPQGEGDQDSDWISNGRCLFRKWP